MYIISFWTFRCLYGYLRIGLCADGGKSKMKNNQQKLKKIHFDYKKTPCEIAGGYGRYVFKRDSGLGA